ncbi:MAG: TatD family hydrolase [Paraglaciecola sp.]|uniref:TatD family hydrolase n=1 Tax=Paraglaciecola sp. TaxID=1920173 RepID=UPI0032673614
MSWIDIGVNLADSRLDAEPVIQRAINAGIEKLIITGTSVQASSDALLLASKQPNTLYTTAGVHPHHAKDFTHKARTILKKLAKEKHVVAIGECGLDFNRNFSSPTQQLHAFEQQLQLASELGLPVFLHERDAFEAQIKLLKQYRHMLVGGVAHCFTGNLAQMNQYLDLGLYIGVTGWVCDTKRGQTLREAVPFLPLENLLLETDAPYLRPKGLPNNRKLDKGNNEPAYLPFIAAELASLMNIDKVKLQQTSYNNTHNLFTKIKLGCKNEH